MTNTLSHEELFHFCEQFSIILHAGISGAEGLRILYEDSHSPKSKEILASLLEGLEETGSLSQALERPGIFPASLIRFVKAGEETGCLDEVMDSLAGQYEQEIEISEQIRSAVTYPLLMLGMMGAVIVILLVKVLPVFRQVFRQMGMEMNGLSLGLLRAGSVISRYSAVFLAAAAVLILCLLFFCCHPKGRKLLYRAVSRFPGLRSISVSMDYGRLTHGLALALRSGFSPDSSLELAGELISHPQVKERLRKTEELLKQGALFSQAMTESGLFQGMDARLVAIGLRAGAGDEVMAKLSARCRETSLSLISRAVSVVEPTIVIILSLLVGLVLLSVMMPLLGVLSEMIV